LESGGRFKFELKFGFKIEFELEGFFEVLLKKMFRFPLLLDSGIQIICIYFKIS